MQRHGDLIVLELDPQIPTMPGSIYNASAIVDSGPDGDSLILVDTGIPGMLPQIGSELRAAGYALGDIRHILITHHDADHIGSLRALVDATGADVLAPAGERPFIVGERRPQKRPSAEAEAEMLRDPDLSAGRRAMLERPIPTGPVDRVLNDGEVLPWAGGVRVVATPGHTAGHTSYFLERSGTLIAGDALTAQDGQLRPPNAAMTGDVPQATASLRRLADLNPAAVLAYHGGLVTEGAAEGLRRLTV